MLAMSNIKVWLLRICPHTRWLRFTGSKERLEGYLLLYVLPVKSSAGAEIARAKIAGRVKIITPDKYCNTLGGVLGTAADAIWESPTYLHGSIKTTNIDDHGLRKLAGENNRIMLQQGIPFAAPSDTLKPNILFTSQWNDYPKEAIVPLSGKSSHAWLLMAGSTNPMQSGIVNGAIIILYTDNTTDTLLLKNPESWWPIEQDYMEDAFAFTIDAARPVRIHLKTGKMVTEMSIALGHTMVK